MAVKCPYCQTLNDIPANVAAGVRQICRNCLKAFIVPQSQGATPPTNVNPIGQGDVPSSAPARAATGRRTQDLADDSFIFHGIDRALNQYDASLAGPSPIRSMADLPPRPPGGGSPLIAGGAGDPGNDITRTLADQQRYQDSSDTVARLLTEIRDALVAMRAGKGMAGTSQGTYNRAEDEKAYFSQVGSIADFVSIFTKKSPGESQSGSNLASFLYETGGMLRRRYLGYGGQRAGTILGGHGIAFTGERGSSWGGGRVGRWAGRNVDRARNSRMGRIGGKLWRAGKLVWGLFSKQKPGAKNKNEEEAPDGVDGGGDGGGDGGDDGQKSKAARAGRALKFLATAAIEAGQSAYQFARAQEQEVRRLGQYGGAQAAAVALLDANRIRRDIDAAEKTGKSSTGLTQSVDRFEKATHGIQTFVTNIANSLGSTILNGFSYIVEKLDPITDVLHRVYDKLPDKKGVSDNQRNNFDVLKQIHDETIRHNNPKWPTGPWGQPERKN